MGPAGSIRYSAAASACAGDAQSEGATAAATRAAAGGGGCDGVAAVCACVGVALPSLTLLLFRPAGTQLCCAAPLSLTAAVLTAASALLAATAWPGAPADDDGTSLLVLLESLLPLLLLALCATAGLPFAAGSSAAAGEASPACRCSLATPPRPLACRWMWWPLARRPLGLLADAAASCWPAAAAPCAVLPLAPPARSPPPPSSAAPPWQ